MTTQQKVTLKKAHDLQHLLRHVLEQHKIRTEVLLSDNPQSDYSLAGTKFSRDMQRRDNLIIAYYELDQLIIQGSVAANIHIKESSIKQLEEQLSFFKNLCSVPPKNLVPTSIFDQEDIDGFAQLLLTVKSNIIKIQDEILELSMRTEIPLSDNVTKVLISEGIIKSG